MAEIMMRIDDVRFEDGKLWRPRYEKLIDYTRAPRSFQFEPAFMLQSAKRGEEAEVRVIFSLLSSENVAFDVLPDGSVRWKLLSDPFLQAALEVSVLDAPENRVCQVLWRRTGAPLTALQICCRHTEGGPKAYTDEWAWTVVDGGICLVVIDPGEDLPKLVPAQNVVSPIFDQRTIRFLGIDQHSRPVYDLFVKGGEDIPPDLVPEPAFRVVHGQDFDFPIALDLPALYADARFEADAGGQADMLYVVPTARPASLAGVPVSSEGDKCTIQWRRPPLEKCMTGVPEATTDPCRQWSTSNFYAKLRNGANQELRVDPTVIEPPACDASGVCGPPRSADE